MYTKGLITRPFITDVTRTNAQPPNAHQKVNGQINFGTFILGDIVHTSKRVSTSTCHDVERYLRHTTE